MIFENYEQSAMFDSYILAGFTLKISTDCDALIEGNIHIKDIGKSDSDERINAINEWGYRFMLLQKVAASANITTQAIEQIALVVLGELPTPPKFGHTKGDSK